MMRTLRYFWTQAWLNFKSLNAIFNPEEFILLDLGYPIISMTFYVLLAAYSFNPASLTHWVVGNAFLLCINVCIFTMGQSINAERAQGRLRTVVTAPTSDLQFLLAKGSFPILLEFVTVLVGFVIGGWIFHIDLSQIAWVPLIGCILAGMASATAFGLFLATFSLVTDSMHFVLNFVATGLFILTGANFPVTQLPLFWRGMSQVLPLTHSIQAASQVTAGKMTGVLGNVLWELGLAVVYFALATVAIRFCERYARKHATLEMF